MRRKDSGALRLGARKLLAVLASGITAVLIGAACSDDPGSEAVAKPDSDGRVTIVMKDHRFEPAEIRVPTNTVVLVTAVNEGSAVHNMLVSGPHGGPQFRSDVRVSSGDSSTFEVEFPTPGSYRFSCGFHLPGMVGAITVSD